MNLLQLGSFNWFDIFLIIIFILLFIAFLRDFKLTRTRSWVVLLGLTSLGGLFLFQRWRRRQLLKQFEEREKMLKELEREYDNLRKKGEITEEAYKDAKEKLEHAKVNEGMAIMKADQRLEEQLEEIERDYSNMTIEKSVAKIKKALQ